MKDEKAFIFHMSSFIFMSFLQRKGRIGSENLIIEFHPDYNAFWGGRPARERELECSFVGKFKASLKSVIIRFHPSSLTLHP